MSDLRAHHVGITVSDLDRSVAFYGDILGFDVLDRFTVSGDAFSTAVGVDDAAGRFAHLDGDGVRVELVEYEPEGDGVPTETLNQSGAKHLGFAVDDLDSFYEGLPSRVRTLSEPQTTESGTRICFLCDPESNLVEVIEA